MRQERGRRKASSGNEGLRLVVAGLSVWVAVTAAGCVFNGGRADAFRCEQGTCPQGLECVGGICVDKDAGRPDAGEDGADAGLPDGSGDAEHDGASLDTGQGDGAAEDAVLDGSIEHGAFEDALPDSGGGCVSDPLTADLGHFTPVHTATSWAFSSSGYVQSEANERGWLALTATTFQ